MSKLWDPALVQYRQAEWVSSGKSWILLINWTNFDKFALIVPCSWDLPKTPPIPQNTLLVGLTCGISRGFGKSQEHGFFRVSKFFTLILLVKWTNFDKFGLIVPSSWDLPKTPPIPQDTLLVGLT